MEAHGKDPGQDHRAALGQAVRVYRTVAERCTRDPEGTRFRVARNLTDEEWGFVSSRLRTPVLSRHDRWLLYAHLLAGIVKDIHDKPFRLPTPEAMAAAGAPEPMVRKVRREMNNALAAVQRAFRSGDGQATR